MPSYNKLKSEAENRWHQRNTGRGAWIRVGTAMCGQSRGAFDVVQSIKNEIKRHNLEIYLDEVGCLGLCFAEPLIDIQKPGMSRLFFREVKPTDIPKIVEDYLVKDLVPADKVLGYLGDKDMEGISDLADLPGMKYQHRVALRNAGVIAPNDIYQYIANGGYAGLNKALSAMDPESVIKEMTDSGLRGRGGAGFPTGVKWSFMVRSPGPPKYILCNCEEGDPGAYNDKGILESDPHTLLEGMTIAGYATGATNGIVFIRHGHDSPIERVEKAIEQSREAGLLGQNILDSDFSFEIEVSLTGESYVAGEETALMDSIEGKRAMPRFKPPFPAAFGVWGKPSTVNNVKSISYAPEIISRGGNWFNSIGPEKCTGTVIICLSGDVENPGMYEVPMGLRLGDVINDIGGGVANGKNFKMLQLGGPLGHILGAESLDLSLDFDSMRDAGAMLGSGGVIVGDEDKCAVDLTRVLVAFCQYESCGKCFPCRLGMTHLLEFVERISRFEGKETDLEMMSNVGQTMESGSLCFHGQLGYNPVRSALEYFADDFLAHINEGRCPTNSCSTQSHLPKNTRPFAHDFIENIQPVRVP